MSRSRPRFAQEQFRTADQLFSDAQGALGPAFGRALDLEQQYGPRLLSLLRAGAPEQTSFALEEFEAAQRGELAGGQQRAFEQALRSGDTARLGALGARQPQQAFNEALGIGELVRNRALQALSMLRTSSGQEFFQRSAPDLATAIGIEQQRGANLQAMLNAKAQAKAAREQFNTQLAIGGLSAAAGGFGGFPGIASGFGGALAGGAMGFGVPFNFPSQGGFPGLNFNFGSTGTQDNSGSGGSGSYYLDPSRSRF